MQGHPSWTGHNEEFWQNVVRWRRKWQTTLVLLLQEPHEQYEKANIRHWKISTPKVSDMLLGKSGGPVLIAPEGMKRLGQSGNDAQLWCIWWWTKEPLDESERGEWKSGLKTQLSENYGHGIQSHHFMVNRWGNNRNNERVYLGELQNHCRWWLQPWNQKTLGPWKKSYTNPR